MIEETIKYSLLLDKYKDLLAHRQAEVCALYFDENLSLYEIAEEFKISKQAVHDALKKAELALDEYEKKLGLVRREREEMQVIGRIREELAKGDTQGAIDLLTQLEEQGV